MAQKKIVHVVGTGTIGEPLLGLFTDFKKHLGIDEIIVAVRDQRGGVLPLRALLDCRLSGIQVTDLPRFFERVHGRVPIESLKVSWLIYGRGFRQNWLRGVMKRAFDLVVAVVLLSIVLLILAEVTPKTLAITHAERVALMAAGPVDRLASFLAPILWAVTLISRALTGGRAARAPYLTEEELISMLHASEEQGVIEEQEHQMIHGIIEIGDKTVREIMIPRTDIVAVEKHAPLKDIVRLFKEHRHTRMPVYDADIDHVVLAECLERVAQGRGGGDQRLVAGGADELDRRLDLRHARHQRRRRASRGLRFRRGRHSRRIRFDTLCSRHC